MTTVLEIAPIAQPRRTAIPIHLERLTAFFLVLGVLWRIGRWLLQYPIWGDEAHLLFNFLNRDYLTLTHQLEHAQVAPLLFLWAEYSMYLLFGPSELALRFFPLLAGIGALFVFERVARLALPRPAALLAVAVLAVSYYPVRHSTEVKPYAFDLLMTLLLLWPALAWRQNPASAGKLFWLAAIAPVALLSSFPTVFAAGAISLALLPSVWKFRAGSVSDGRMSSVANASGSVRFAYVLFNLLLVGTFLGQMLFVGRNVGSETAADGIAFLHKYWKDWFPPGDLLGTLIWFVKAHTGSMFAYPVGGTGVASLATTILCVLGGWSLWLRGYRFVLGIILGAMGLSIVAAFAHRYPYGGSARIAQHLAGPICLLNAAGIAAFWGRFPRIADFGLKFTFVLLAIIGIGGAIHTWHRPYKTEADRVVRNLVRSLREEAGPIYVLQRHDFLRAQMLWYIKAWKVPVRFEAPDTNDVSRLEARFEPPAIEPARAWILPAESKDVPVQYVNLYRPKETP